MHRTFLSLMALCGWMAAWGGQAMAAEVDNPRYTSKEPHRDGIGKFYFGREIARVMGHPAADWLERPEREKEEKPRLLLKALNIESGSAIADIGAGSGYYTRRFAEAVGPGGKVYAVDIQPEMLDRIRKDMEQLKLENVEPVLGTLTNPQLPPNSIDLAVMIDVYHEFSHPFEMVEGICRSLKPGGRLVFVEYRAEDPAVPIKELHKMSVAQVRIEAAPHPLEWERTVEDLPWQHVIVFRKPSG